ncbi:MAG: hypothetical protein GEV13_31915 [Rhodospirillales bacterium]|nr:hypothetical protein [Rhodospirillales bacterium]
MSRPLVDCTLVPASPLRVRMGKHFHLLAARGKPLRDIVVAIRDWLLDQMRQDMERVAPLIDRA